MARFETKQADDTGRKVLAVTGPVTVPHILEIRDALCRELRDATEVTLDLSGASDLDLSGIQVLCAAERDAAAAGQRLAWRDSVGEELLAMIRICGFDAPCDPANTGA